MLFPPNITFTFQRTAFSVSPASHLSCDSSNITSVTSYSKTRDMLLEAVQLELCITRLWNKSQVAPQPPLLTAVLLLETLP